MRFAVSSSNLRRASEQDCNVDDYALTHAERTLLAALPSLEATLWARRNHHD